MGNPGHVDCSKTEKGGVITLPYGIRYFKVYVTCTNTGAMGLVFFPKNYKKQYFVFCLFSRNLIYELRYSYAIKNRAEICMDIIVDT